MIQNCSVWRVLEAFFDRPAGTHQLRALSRELKLGLPSVRNNVLTLEKEGLVRKVQLGHLHGWRAAGDAPLFKVYKKLDLIRRLYESGLVAVLEAKLSYPTLMLFGSCAYGEDTEQSDIDIAVLAEEKRLDLAIYEKTLHRRIELHFFRDVAQMKKTPELFNNICNGIALSGFLKVV